jgi:hypothetical protein
MDSPADEALLVRYLIGDCSEDERTLVERQFFADTEMFVRLCELEEELAARYARGELRADERAQFERAYHAPPRRDRLILNLALGRILASAPPSNRPEAAPIAAASWRQWLTFEPAAARWALAAATVVLLIGSLIQFRQTDRLRTALDRSQQDVAGLRARLDEAERRTAESEQRNAASETTQTTAPVIATFVLTPGLTRNASGPARVNVPSEATALRFELQLDFDGGYARMKADLRTDAGTSLWSQDGLQPEKTAARRVVTVTIPATAINTGSYELLLQGVLNGGSTEDAASYYFTAARR